jgi:hypothetical protein
MAEDWKTTCQALHVKYFGAQDKIAKETASFEQKEKVLENENYIKEFRKLKTDLAINMSVAKPSRMLIIQEPTNVYFNQFVLKITDYPNIKEIKISDILEEIYLMIGSTRLDRIYPFMLETWFQVEKDIYIPLPFLPKQAILYCFEYYRIEIGIQHHKNETIKFALFADTYTLLSYPLINDLNPTDNHSSPKEMINDSIKEKKGEIMLLQHQFNGYYTYEEYFVNSNTIKFSPIWFNHPVHSMSIVGLNKECIKKIELILDDIIVVSKTMREIEEINQSFDIAKPQHHPTLIFSPFTFHSDTTINFSRVDKTELIVYLNSGVSELHYDNELGLYTIVSHIFKYENGTGQLLFS